MMYILEILSLVVAAYAIWKSFGLPEHADNVAPEDLARPRYVSLLKFRLNLSAWALLLMGLTHFVAVSLAIDIHQSGSTEKFGGLLLLVIPRLGGLLLCFIAALTYPTLRLLMIISMILAVFVTIVTFGIGLALIIPVAAIVTAIAGVAIVIHSLSELMRIKWQRDTPAPRRENPAPRRENPVPPRETPAPQRETPRRRTRFQASEVIIGLEVSGNRGKIIVSPHERMPRVMHISEYGRISPDVILNKPPFAFIAPNREGKGMWLLEPLLDDVSRIQLNGVALSPGNANSPLPPRTVITLRNPNDAHAVCGTLIVKYKPYISRPAHHSEVNNP